jgi:hypothetical protein
MNTFNGWGFPILLALIVIAYIVQLFQQFPV